MKISSGGSVSPASSVFNLWTSSVESLNTGVAGATSLSAGSPGYKSDVVHQWNNHYIRAVRELRDF